MKFRALALPSLFAAVLSGCASMGDFQPLARLLDANLLNIRTSLASNNTPAPWPSTDWWQALGDPQLSQLMSEALASNPGLRIAQARLRQSEAIAGIADAGRYPRLDAGFNSTRQRYTENGAVPPPLAGQSRTDNRLSLNIAYDLDFWGVHEGEYRTALGNARAAEVEIQAARLLLSTTLAHSYIQFDRAHRLAAIAEASLHQRQETLALVKRRVDAGLDSQVELRQAEAGVAAAHAERTASREQIALLGHQLAALAGTGPDQGAALQAPSLLKTLPAALPSVLPAELIGRRPDIVAQRWRIEATLGQVDSARGQFYPNINLLAFVGMQSFGFDKLLKTGSEIRGIGPAISLPLFDAGRLRSNLRARQAEVDLAVEQYNQNVVDAVRDVADQIVSRQAQEQQYAEQTVALHKYEEAWRLSRLRYEKGLSNYLTVLVAEGQYLAQQRSDSDLRARRHDTNIALIRALGGGMQPLAPTTVAANSAANAAPR